MWIELEFGSRTGLSTSLFLHVVHSESEMEELDWSRASKFISIPPSVPDGISLKEFVGPDVATYLPQFWWNAVPVDTFLCFILGIIYSIGGRINHRFFLFESVQLLRPSSWIPVYSRNRCNCWKFLGPLHVLEVWHSPKTVQRPRDEPCLLWPDDNDYTRSRIGRGVINGWALAIWVYTLHHAWLLW